jgi:hypothetical protein
MIPSIADAWAAGTEGAVTAEVNSPSLEATRAKFTWNTRAISAVV